jgi:hypothetical protein
MQVEFRLGNRKTGHIVHHVVGDEATAQEIIRREADAGYSVIDQDCSTAASASRRSRRTENKNAEEEQPKDVPIRHEPEH